MELTSDINMQLKPNSTLQGGKYRILRHISSGGFGNTYEGVHTMMDVRLAIKEFFPRMFCYRDETTANVKFTTQTNGELMEKLRKKFNEEAVAVFKMKHDNIVRVTDVFEENGTAYYVMEFVDGTSLQDMVKERGPLSETEALGYIRQVADALQYVHSLNRLHLDIKPGNIMVDGVGKALLIDFGASKHYDAESGENTSTLMGVNTQGYAPIEQTTRGFTSFSPATDIYALGATMYKLLTGITPPDANMLMLEEDELQPLPMNITAATREMVRRAMSLKRKDRPQSIGELMSLCDPSQKVVNEPLEDTEATVVELQEPMQGESNSDKIHFCVKGVDLTMVKVEGGEFLMEDNARGVFGNWVNDEKPTHRVGLDTYYIGQTVVTQALWEAVMGSNPSTFRGPNLPVEKVSWFDCQEFVRKLNQLTGKEFRLPTEAEWEYAARGGKKSRGYKYSGSNDLDDVAWYVGNSGGKTHAVGTKKANELGLYDMTGNVMEWCQDWYGDYDGGSQLNPTGPTSGSFRVNRGGGSGFYSENCRVSNRSYSPPSSCSRVLGLRLVLAP